MHSLDFYRDIKIFLQHKDVNVEELFGKLITECSSLHQLYNKNIKLSIHKFKASDGGDQTSAIGMVKREKPNLIHINESKLDDKVNVLFTLFHEFRHSQQYILNENFEITNNGMYFNAMVTSANEPLYSVSPLERDANAFALKELSDVISFFKENDKDFDISELEKFYQKKVFELNRDIRSSMNVLYQNRYIKQALSDNYSIENDTDIMKRENYPEFQSLSDIFYKESEEQVLIPEIYDLKEYGDIDSSYRMSFGDHKHKLYVQHGSNGTVMTLVNTEDMIETPAIITNDTCFIHSTSSCYYVPYPTFLETYDKDMRIRDEQGNKKHIGKVDSASLNNELSFLKKAIPAVLSIDQKYCHKPDKFTYYLANHNFEINKSVYQKVATRTGFHFFDKHNRELSVEFPVEKDQKIEKQYTKREVIEEDDYFLQARIINKDMRIAALKTGSVSDIIIMNENEVNDIINKNVGSAELNRVLSQSVVYETGMSDREVFDE